MSRKPPSSKSGTSPPRAGIPSLAPELLSGTPEWPRAGGRHPEPSDLPGQEGLPEPGPAPAASTLPLNIGRYQIQGLIGSGGMGIVYRALDPVLQRSLALKVIRLDDPELAARLLHEAQAQARVEHPHICKVFESSLHEGRPFIAMQLIQGETLPRCAGRMHLEQKVEVIGTVALALHAAHRQGLIHRDVKPSNIIVEQDEDDRWIPYLTDFGLAREENVDGQTISGTLAGTPQYMAPEQARGEIRAIGRRTDVYGLGATFYEILTGAPPFKGKSLAETLIHIITDDPVPVRQLVPSLPADLETIIGKCLEKDPERRYDSARAMAEDLHRFLDGDPVQAKPPSLFYRFRRKAVKHWQFVILGLLLLAVSLTFSATLLRTQWIAREQAHLAAELIQEVQSIELLLRSARLAPLHDLRPELKIARNRLAHIERRTLEEGSWAEGPGRYAMGRGCLALGALADARKHLERAWAAGYRTPAVAYVLGTTLGQIYQRELSDAERIEDNELRAARKRELGQELRLPASSYLRQATDPLSPPEYMEAQLALYDGRFKEALALTRLAREAAPWLYETYRLEGDILVARGLGNHQPDAAALTSADLQAAGKPYALAAEIARSDPDAYLAECARLLALLRQWDNSELLFQETVTAITAACKRAETADPDRVEIPRYLAEAYWRLGCHQFEYTRLDPEPTFDKALTLARRAMKADPADAVSRIVASEVLASIAIAIRNKGLDCRPVMHEGLELAREAIRIDPRLAWAYITAGKQESNLATMDQQMEGRSAIPRLEEAVNYFQKAMRLQPGLAGLHKTLGNTFFGMALSRGANGQDPRPDYLRAINEYRQALRLQNKDMGAACNIAEAVEASSRWTLRQGGNPRTELVGVLDLLRRMERQSLPFSEIPALEGAIQRLLAIQAMREGINPEANLALGRQALLQAIQLKPDLYSHYVKLGLLELTEAQWRRRQDQPAIVQLDAARKALGRALELNSHAVETLQANAMLCLEDAHFTRRKGLDATPILLRGLTFIDQALKVEPRNVELLEARAELTRMKEYRPQS